MVNQKDILARLQAGESADVIAQELVDALNAANAEYAAEQEKATQANAKAEYVQEIGELIKDYILEFHGDTAIAEMIAEQEINPTEIVAMLDEAFVQLDKEIRKLKEIEKMFGGILAQIEKHEAAHSENCDCGCADKAVGKIEPNPDALMGFLKANGLA